MASCKSVDPFVDQLRGPGVDPAGQQSAEMRTIRRCLRPPECALGLGISADSVVAGPPSDGANEQEKLKPECSAINP